MGRFLSYKMLESMSYHFKNHAGISLPAGLFYGRQQVLLTVLYDKIM